MLIMSNYQLHIKRLKTTIASSISFVQYYYLKMIQTAGNLLEQTLLKSIHAVTSQGFERELPCLCEPTALIVNVNHRVQLG